MLLKIRDETCERTQGVATINLADRTVSGIMRLPFQCLKDSILKLQFEVGPQIHNRRITALQQF